MKCPNCKANLPFRFAFVIGSSRRNCPGCGVVLAPTKGSGTRVGKIVGPAGGAIGGIMGFLVVKYSLQSGHWFIGISVGLIGLLVYSFISFVIGARVIEFKVVKT